MAQKPVNERVKNTIIDQFGCKADQVTPEAKFVEDLGMDDLDAVELVMALEEEFDIEIPGDSFEALKTVGQLIAYVEERQL